MQIVTDQVNRWLVELAHEDLSVGNRLRVAYDDDPETACLITDWVRASLQMVARAVEAALQQRDERHGGDHVEHELASTIADACNALWELRTEPRFTSTAAGDAVVYLTAWGASLLQPQEEPF